jgi:hypothetical protein
LLKARDAAASLRTSQNYNHNEPSPLYQEESALRQSKFLTERHFINEFWDLI